MTISTPIRILLADDQALVRGRLNQRAWQTAFGL